MNTPYTAPVIHSKGSLVTRTLSSLTAVTTNEAAPFTHKTNAADITSPNSTT
jgi:hypothetical protein